jgi:hypothetical protein
MAFSIPSMFFAVDEAKFGLTLVTLHNVGLFEGFTFDDPDVTVTTGLLVVFAVLLVRSVQQSSLLFKFLCNT